MRTSNQDRGRLVTEAVAFGIGYVSVLVWIGSALVGSFGYNGASPYWPAFPQIRTDTAGAVGFLAAIVTLFLSKYLELRRRSNVPTEPTPRTPGVLAVQAAADTAMFLSTAMVIYLSFNAFTHPVTLSMRLTHLAPWPTEGLVRIVGLLICLVAVATRRYLRATATRPVSVGAATGQPRVSA